MPEELPLDAAVRTAYSEILQTADQILVGSAVRGVFLFRVAQLVPDASETDVLAHLVRLRKRGQAKGGLPRKQR